MSSELVETANQRLDRFVAEITDDDVLDPEEARRQIALRIIMGETAEEILSGSEAEKARDYIGQPIRIVGVKWNKSRKPGAFAGRYAIIECVDADGQPFVISSGAMQIMLQLWRLKDVGALPVVAKVVEQEEGGEDGNKAMWLELVPSF